MTPNDRYLFCAYIVPVGLIGLAAADLFWGIFQGVLFDNALAPFFLATAMPYTVAKWAGACWNCRAWATQIIPFVFWPRNRCERCGACRDQKAPRREPVRR